MASIVTSVLKATVGFLVTKGRDAAAERLKEGDATDQQFRDMIVRELDEIKSKLDGLARKDLLTSISFFKEGIVFLYQALDNSKCGGEEGAVNQQMAMGTVTDGAKTISLVRGQGNSQLSDLDDSGKRALADAKKRFDDARMKATEAFNNTGLSTADRILAMQYRVMSTILQKIDNPREAIAACKLCLEELHSMPAVEKSFHVKESGGFRSLFNRDEREEIIQSVHDVNGVIGRVVAVLDGVFSREFDIWPCINFGRYSTIKPEQDGDFLQLVPWSFGQEGEGKLESPQSITTTTHGDFIVADKDVVKVFNHGGQFVHSFIPEPGCAAKDVATDHLDSLYVLFSTRIYAFDKQAKRRRVLYLEEGFVGESITINVEQSVFVCVKCLKNNTCVVQVYDDDGQFVNSFGSQQNWFRPDPAGILTYGFVYALISLFSFPWNRPKPNLCYTYPTGIATTCDGGVVALEKECTEVTSINRIGVFDGQGKYTYKSRGVVYDRSRAFIAVHLPTDQVIIAGQWEEMLDITIYTKECHFVRSISLNTDKLHSLSGVAVTMEGQIAVLCTMEGIESKSKTPVVYVI